MPRELPSGTVTFLFTDVEGSTRLLHELGAEAYSEALAEHRRTLRKAFAAHDGVEVDTQGDAFFFAFPTAPAALAAAREGGDALGDGPIRVRIGLHTGTPLVTEEGYVGADVHRAARIAAAGHGGQVLVSASTAALVDGEKLLDLGEHRLKDLSASERIFQLGDGSFPSLKTLYQTNLPVPATPFLGRDRELAELGELLGQARLLTLTGPGGTGKTRLALQAAGSAADGFPGGVWWVPLAALRDPALVLETAAKALGAPDGLAEHVGDRRLLLLLDNFEHVIAAADELALLLAQCPSLSLLVTSRELLRLPGEQAYPVPPLSPGEGPELFVARARAVQPHFRPDAAVAELCARLDNLPLALELAAARVSVLSPEQLLERLGRRLDLLKAGRGVDPRQQTLRATIEWSHELLDEDEKRLFRRLAVFRGGCTVEAAEAICDAELDVLQALVDKSLVRVRDQGRFWMLETIREYAEERLAESGEAAELARRHAEFLLALARSVEQFVTVTREWLDTMEAEHDNVRAALDRLPAQGEIQLALELAEAVWRFWKTRGYPAEGRRRLEGLLDLDPRPTAERAHALNALVGFVVDLGDADAGRRNAEEALAVHREHGDAWGIARSVYMLGYAAIESGDFVTARGHFEEAVRLMAELGHEHYVGIATFNLGWAYEELGDVARAKELAEENLRRARALSGASFLQAGSLDTIAGFAHDEGRFDEALDLKRESLRISRDVGDTVHVLDSLTRIANSLVRVGAATPAAQLLAASLALHEEAAVPVPLYQQRRHEELLEHLRAQLDEAELAEAWERGERLSLDEAVALALDA